MLLYYLSLACAFLSILLALHFTGTQSQPYRLDYFIKNRHGEHYRKESGIPGKSVRGSYGIKDIQGIYRRVQYVADHGGFRAHVETNESGIASQDPADVKIISLAHPNSGKEVIQDEFGVRLKDDAKYGKKSHSFGGDKEHDYGNTGYGRDTYFISNVTGHEEHVHDDSGYSKHAYNVTKLAGKEEHVHGDSGYGRDPYVDSKLKGHEEHIYSYAGCGRDQWVLCRQAGHKEHIHGDAAYERDISDSEFSENEEHAHGDARHGRGKCVPCKKLKHEEHALGNTGYRRDTYSIRKFTGNEEHVHSENRHGRDACVFCKQAGHDYSHSIPFPIKDVFVKPVNYKTDYPRGIKDVPGDLSYITARRYPDRPMFDRGY